MARHRGHKVGKKRHSKSKVRLEPTLKHLGHKGGRKRGGSKRSRRK